jgi:hypothetical protein
VALDQDYAVDAAELPTSAYATGPLPALKYMSSCSFMQKPHCSGQASSSLPFNAFVKIFESFAVFLAVGCCFFLWEKFTQQEAFTIPEHGRHFFRRWLNFDFFL